MPGCGPWRSCWCTVTRRPRLFGIPSWRSSAERTWRGCPRRGFGAPLPDGWAATYLDYRDWLEDELAHFDAPVDLVGHDWGGGHVLNVVMHCPELVRSWASDVVGLFDPDYVWHDLAQVWQTPGDGEQLIETMMGATPQERAEQLVGLGVTPEVATKMAAAQGPEMGRAILLLYRSARQAAMAEAGRELQKAAARPGLSLLATEDHYVGSEEIRRRAAECAGARTEVLRGWAIGGWCRTRRAARPRWPAFGTRSTRKLGGPGRRGGFPVQPSPATGARGASVSSVDACAVG